MAFVSRSKRQLSLQSNATSSNLGPGSYLSTEYDFSPSVKYSYAPFSSTSRRDHQNQQDLPGPGSYFRKPTRIRKSRKSNSVFKSTSVRFPHERPMKEELPGPGSYSVKDDSWIKKKVKPTTQGGDQEKARIVWVKVSTAPSIPAGEHAHGYEEGPHGELIRQKPPHRGYRGTNVDCAGPGEYNVPPAPTTVWDQMKGKGTFRSKTKRGTFIPKPTTDPNLGPGCYERTKEKEEPPYMNSAVFSSNTKRTTWKTKENEPGPGAYIDTYKHTSFVPKKVPTHQQNFGSSSIRGLKLVDENTPGPGHFYQEDNTPKKEFQQYSAGMHGPFLSTSDRFSTKIKENLPGPGQYDKSNELGFTNELQKKTKVGAYGVFGSTARRFSKKKSHAPGVGAYEVTNADNIGKVRRSDNRSSVFLSKSKRGIDIGKNQAPDPTKYDVRPKWGKNKESLSRAPISFGSKDNRFKETVKTEVPGVGRYNADGSFFRTYNKKHFNTKVSNFDTVKRFESEKDTKQKWWKNKDLPGPGEYEGMQDQWNKPSHNVTIV